MRLLLGLVLIASPVSAQIESVFPKQPTERVTDLTGVLGPTSGLNQRLADIAATGRVEIAVAVLPTIKDYEPYEVAVAIGRTWGVGAKAEIGDPTRNNGVVMLVVPKTAQANGECFIATGHRVEGWLTDGRAARVCDLMIESFRESDYAGGVSAGIEEIDRQAIAAATPPTPKVPREPLHIPGWVFAVLGSLGLVGAVTYRRRAVRRAAEEAELARLRAERQEVERLRAEKRAAEIRVENARLAAERKAAALEAAKREQARWAALTPAQQQAELEARRVEEERQRMAEAEAAKLRAIEAAKRRKRDEEEEEERRRRRRRDDDSSSGGFGYGGSSGSSGGGFGGLGGGGGFSGGGGGRSW